jgi:hypothetical protein
MGDQQGLFLCILASGSFAALLGGSFGAVVGAITWLSGRAAGTILGFQMARAYESAAESKLAPGPKGALIGGTDGAVFLGSIGVLVGAVVASRTPVPSEVLEPTAAAAVMLVGTCIVFGMMALVLTRSGTHAVVPLFGASLLGAVVGLYCGRSYGLFMGLVLGLVAGTVIAFLWGPRRS